MVRPPMADPTQVDEEFGKRLAAARGYSRINAREWADRIGLDRGTLRRYEMTGKIDPLKRSGIIERCVAETKLPREFFSINLDDLPEMVAAWRQVQDEASNPARAIAAQEKDEGSTLPPDPSGSQNEEQEP